VQTVAGDRHGLMKKIFQCVANATYAYYPKIDKNLKYNSNIDGLDLTTKAPWQKAFNTVIADYSNRKMKILKDTGGTTLAKWNNPLLSPQKSASHKNAVRGWLSCMTEKEWEKFLIDTEIKENEKNTRNSIHGKIIAWVIKKN